MIESELPPVTRSVMDAWGAPGATTEDLSIAAVAAGVDPADPALAAPDGGGLVEWTPPVGAVPAPAQNLAERLRSGWSPDAPATAFPPGSGPLRLVVRGAIVPGEVVGRLLDSPGLGSAILPVTRAPGALRRRAWNWPLRIGVADDDLLAALEALKDAGPVPPDLVDLSDVRTTPGAVDLLVLRLPPGEAAAFVMERRQVASAIVCSTDSTAAWPIVDAQFALARAATAAVLTALTPAAEARDLAVRTLLSVRYLSHAHPLDVALTAGFDRQVLIAAEPDALEAAALPTVLRRRARRAAFDLGRMAEMAEMAEMAGPDGGGAAMAGAEPPSGLVTSATDELAQLPDGRFDHETREASRSIGLQETIDHEVDAAAAAQPRLLQVYTGPASEPEPDNLLHAGETAVDVFLGPFEKGAIHGLRISDQALGFDDPDVDVARLTIVLAPLVPEGDAVRAELDVPRLGRSRNARLIWTLPDAGLVQARILVLHRNRVLQTARLTGRVGAVAKLTDRVILWDAGNLDDRQPFDRSFVLNHDASGRSRMVSHADGATTIQPMDEIGTIADRIRAHLMRATQLTSTGKAATAAARQILVDVATEGHDLYDLLIDHLERFDESQRIQIVTARSGRFLPLELVYDRPAPDPDATLCENWTSGARCGPQCFADAADTSIICPSVFWGMGRVIERQQARLTDKDGNAFVVSVSPTRRRRTLSVASPVLAASAKVREIDVKKTKDAVAGVTLVPGWKQWKERLGTVPTDLLLLMPHSDPKAGTLEISGMTVRTGQIEPPYVTGGKDVTPIVVLLGCDTDGSSEDPAGYATRFLQKGAAVVFSTLTLLLGRHAAMLTQRMSELLRTPGRKPQPLGDVIAEFRRESVRAGLISALAVTAYGDVDWKV